MTKTLKRKKYMCRCPYCGKMNRICDDTYCKHFVAWEEGGALENFMNVFIFVSNERSKA